MFTKKPIITKNLDRPEKRNKDHRIIIIFNKLLGVKAFLKTLW